MSNIVSDLVENIANMRPDSIEVISTEDMLSRINKYNEEVTTVDPDTEAVLVACDAVKLFPSLRALESSTAVREATINIVSQSGLKVEGLDYEEVAKYIRMNMTDWEIRSRKLSKIVPKRKYNKGAMPGMAGAEAKKKTITEEEKKFEFPSVELTEADKTNLLATALEIAARFMFKNHVYSFANENYKQSDSGPCGMRSTMARAD